MFFPELQAGLYKGIYKYKESDKLFMYEVLAQISYFRDISVPLFHEIIFRFKRSYLNDGEILMKELDGTDKLYIVEYGYLEIYFELEGNEFIIDRLPAGSVLNHRSIFTEDEMVVNIRAHGLTYIKTIDEQDIEELKQIDEQFGKKLGLYTNRLLSDKVLAPLDYVIHSHHPKK
jgi:CRP-like cAMP-binding protein